MKTVCYMFQTIMIGVMLAALATPAYAASEWEAGITVSVRNASNRLNLGQRSDATDGFDYGYDVPAMLAGDVRAYFICDGKKLWRDIKSATADYVREWDLFVESPLSGETVTISWDPAALGGLILKDPSTGAVVDMRTARSYVYVNTGPRELVLETKEVK